MFNTIVVLPLLEDEVHAPILLDKNLYYFFVILARFFVAFTVSA